MKTNHSSQKKGEPTSIVGHAQARPRRERSGSPFGHRWSCFASSAAQIDTTNLCGTWRVSLQIPKSCQRQNEPVAPLLQSIPGVDQYARGVRNWDGEGEGHKTLLVIALGKEGTGC